MGKHFDALADIVNKGMIGRDEMIKPDGKQVLLRDFLMKMLGQASLFEFPRRSYEIKNMLNKNKAELNKYILEYLSLSEENDTPLLLPAKITAIEDLDSMTILMPIAEHEFRVINSYAPGLPMPDLSNLGMINAKTETERVIEIGDVHLNFKEEGVFQGGVSLYYYARWNGKKKMNDYKFIAHKLLNSNSTNASKSLAEIAAEAINTLDMSCAQAITQASLSYIMELAYIMDLSKFVVQEESRESRRQTEKESRRPINVRYTSGEIRKTYIRPRFVFYGDETEVTDLFEKQTGGKKKPHAVRGHLRTFSDNRFINKKGKTTFIKQYWTGDGSYEKENKIYSVWLKEGPGLLRPIAEK